MAPDSTALRRWSGAAVQLAKALACKKGKSKRAKKLYKKCVKKNAKIKAKYHI
jgi:hypothetical protein